MLRTIYNNWGNDMISKTLFRNTLFRKTQHGKTRCSISVVSLLMSLPLSMPLVAFGQTDSEDEADQNQGRMEEIVVTASHRATNMMDTPMGIGAVTGDRINELGAQEMGEIFRMVSGLRMGGEGAGQRRYSIRGITSQQSNSVRDTAGSTVAVYLDGASLTSALGPARQITGNLFDIERVEVLKGPQGTLFGEGAQGGAIRYIYKSPSLSGFDASVKVGLSGMSRSGDNSTDGNVMVNVPLIDDTLAARAVLFSSSRAGWIDRRSDCTISLTAWDDYAGGAGPLPLPDCSSVVKDVNAWDTSGGRVALKYFGEGFSLEGAAYWVSQEGNGTQYTPTDDPYVSDVRPFTGVSGDGWDDYQIYRLTGNFDLSFGTLTAISTLTQRDTYTFRELFDPVVRYIGYARAASANSTGRCQLMVANPEVNCPMPADHEVYESYGWDGWTEVDRSTHEIRLVSNDDNRLRWTAGVYYKTSSDWSWSGDLYNLPDDRKIYEEVLFSYLPTEETSHETTATEKAIYGELDYDITDTVELTLGGRWAKLEQDFVIGVHADRIANLGAKEYGDWDVPQAFRNFLNFQQTSLGKSDDSVFSPKVVLSWRPADRDLMAYASYSNGFRPGNANRGVLLSANRLDDDADAIEQTGGDLAQAAENRAEAAALRQWVFFGPDEVNSYEIGSKMTVFEGRAQIQASVYFVDWQDVIQRATRQLPDGTTNTFNQNEGAAEVRGLDLDVTAWLTDRLKVTLAAAYIDTELTKAAFNQGNELIYTSPVSGTIQIDYDHQINNNLRATLHFDYSYADKQQFNAENNIVLPSSTIANARLTVREQNDKWRVVLWSKNLFNQEIVRDRYSDLTWGGSGSAGGWLGEGLGTYQYLDPPRSVGLDFTWNL